jgi:hypothetical protein
MGAPKKYPAPSRSRWAVAIEFLDGRRIEGTDDTDVLEAWGRLLGWMAGRYLTVPEVKERAARMVEGFYGAPLPPDAETLPDDEFLNVLSETGVLAVIRR